MNYNQQYYQKNKEKWKQYNKTRVLSGKKQAYGKKYYQRHKTWIKIRSRIWEEKNHEKRLIQKKKLLSKKAIIFSKTKTEFIWALRRWAKIIRLRDKQICQICNKTAEVSHHIFYQSTYPQLALNTNNGISLCKEHHNEIHRFHSFRSVRLNV